MANIGAPEIDNVLDQNQRIIWAQAHNYNQDVVQELFEVAERQVRDASAENPFLENDVNLQSAMIIKIMHFAGDRCDLCQRNGHRVAGCPYNYMMWSAYRG